MEFPFSDLKKFKAERVTHLGLGELRLSPIRKRSKGRNRNGSLCQGGDRHAL